MMSPTCSQLSIDFSKLFKFDLVADGVLTFSKARSPCASMQEVSPSHHQRGRNFRFYSTVPYFTLISVLFCQVSFNDLICFNTVFCLDVADSGYAGDWNTSMSQDGDSSKSGKPKG